MNLIDIDGVRIEVRRIAAPEGASGAAPLVFLHEGLGSVAMWRDWPDQLCAATGRAGVVISRRGYGRSDPVPDVRGEPRMHAGRRSGRLQPDYMHREAWEVLPALLAQLQVQQSGAGGPLGRRHDRPAPRQPPSRDRLRRPGPARDRGRHLDCRHHPGTRGVSERRPARAPRAAFMPTWMAPSGSGTTSGSARTSAPSTSARTAGASRAPLLAIQGVDDPYGTMAQIDEIAARAPQTRLLKLPHCGHSPHREQPEAVNEAIRLFLAGLRQLSVSDS